MWTKALHYLAGNVINNLIMLLFLPIFSRYMIPAEYAVYSNLIIFITLARLFYLLGFNQSIISFFYKENSEDYRYSFISSMYIAVIIGAVFFSGLIIILQKPITLLIVKDLKYLHLIKYSILIIITQTFYVLTASILKMLGRSLNYTILGVINNLSQLFLFSYGALIGKFSVEDVLFYVTISSFIVMLISLFNISFILKSFQLTNKNKFDLDILLPAIKFGAIMIPGTIALLGMRIFDRLMLTNLSSDGLADTGIYAMGYKIGAVMHVLVSIVSMTFLPYLMKFQEEERASSKVRVVEKIYLLLAVLLGSGIILFSKDLFVYFIDAAYIKSSDIVFIGAISTFLHGIFNLINIGFYKTQKGAKIAVTVILGTTINILLNWLLIPRFGIWGAGYASIASYLVIVSINYYSVKKIYTVKFQLYPVFIASAFMICLAFIVSFINVSLINLIIKILVFSSVSIFILMKNKSLIKAVN
ncbi:MAG: polysaccharide biosynthesis C-terminal domain-containing protein [Candidatus Cloacimonadales bacterium]